MMRRHWLLLILATTGCGKVAQQPAALEYVNAATCAGCHAAIAQTYRQTGMGRSLTRPSPANTSTGSYFHQASESTFTVLERGGKFYQRREQKGFGGQAANVMEKEIHYVMGSGNVARTYLHRTAENKLIELPLSWYAEGGGTWAMSPGFDQAAHLGFRRAISNECMFCHNAYPAETAERRGEEPVFGGELKEGIDCQRCHGPGSEHVRVAQRAGAKKEELQAAIVNPARLTGERQMEVCMQCHLETTSFPLPDALVRFGRGPFSFRPGEALGEFKVFFDHAPGAGREGKFEIVSAAYRLRQAACFLKSGGKMQCTTCHNPHGGGERKKVNAACAGCHAAKLAAGHFAKEDCAGCHMPQRRTEDVVHAVVTDHLIQREKPTGNLLAALAERHEVGAKAYRGEVAPYYPRKMAQGGDDELLLAVAQVLQKSNLENGIGRLKAAVEKRQPARGEYWLLLADALRGAGRLDEALPHFEEAVKRDPGFVAARLQWGAALRQAKRGEKALEVLKEALARNPDRAIGWYELGMAQLEGGDRAQAMAAFEKALSLDPDMADAHNTMGGIWLAMGDTAKAEAAAREAIRIQPAFADAQNNLGSVLSIKGELAEACFHFEAALRVEPRHVRGRYNYALALARMQRFDAARKQVEGVVNDDPAHAGARQVLGALLAGKGDTAGAIRQYREALRLQPDFGRAMVGLAPVLLSVGDVRGAVEILEKAAASADPGIRAQAAEMLGRMKR